jgi:HSP20 family protein
MPLPPRRRSLFDDFFRDFPTGYSVKPLHGDPLPSPEDIKIEVKEKGDNIVIQAELPGVGKDDIDVSIDRNVVTIRAEVKQYDADTENDKVLHSERYYGSVQRSLSLPSEVDADKAVANQQDGMLTLTLPKKSSSQTKKISVG